MPETDAIARPAAARALLGFHDVYAPRDKQGVDGETTTQAIAEPEPSPREPAHADDVSHEGFHSSKTSESQALRCPAVPPHRTPSRTQIAGRSRPACGTGKCTDHRGERAQQRHAAASEVSLLRYARADALAQRIDLAGSPERPALHPDREGRSRQRSAAAWRMGGGRLLARADIGLAMPFFPAKLRADLARQPLQAVFVSEIRRHQRVIELSTGTIEIAFDQGFLKSGDRSLPVSEIELELKAGSAAAIYDLALRLAEHGPLRPSIRSKSARGFDLIYDAPPAARRPRKLRLDASIALYYVLATVLRSLSSASSSIAARRRGWPQSRGRSSASRRAAPAASRIRADAHDGIAGASWRALQSDARWLAHSVSAARGWDIFQTETRPAVAEACPMDQRLRSAGADC